MKISSHHFQFVLFFRVARPKEVLGVTADAIVPKSPIRKMDINRASRRGGVGVEGRCVRISRPLLHASQNCARNDQHDDAGKCGYDGE